MTLLVLGLALWSVAHWFKRLAPALRAKMGNGGKGLVAVLLLLAIWLMVRGYGQAPFQPLWDLGAPARWLNNLLMLIAVALMGAGKSKSRLRGLLRHPMLDGVIVWAFAHLLVNGDTASVVLFGGLGAWAVISMGLINRAEPHWQRWHGGTMRGDLRLAAISLVLFAVITAIHGWIGPSPF